MAANEFLENTQIWYNSDDFHSNLKSTPTKRFFWQDLFNCEDSTLETYFCKNCAFQTTLIILLKEHCCTPQSLIHKHRTEDLIRYYICKKCNFKTYSALKWLKHLTNCLKKRRSIINNTPVEQVSEQGFKCEHCSFRTKQTTSLTLHNHIKHKSMNAVAHPKPINTNPQFQCDRCPFLTYEKHLLQQHVTYLHAPQKWYRCDKCAYKTRSSNNLTAHKKHHLDDEHLQCVHDSSIKWLFCDQCPSRFKKESWLKYHIHFEHVKNVLFECEQCPYKSNRRSEISKHVIARHTHENDINWYKCEHCDFKSKEKLGLRRHVVRRHTSEENIRWFKCDICSFKTKQHGGLIDHTIRKHMKEDEIQWFQCGDCEYRAKMKDDLRKHEVLRHADKEDVEWFQCEECGFRTKVKLYMNTHKKRRHGRKSAMS